ncbi:MAG: DMT family transporter [Prevotellaceae bacterium]|nr:DMT family transporter [Prevotellaceae bacterium]
MRDAFIKLHLSILFAGCTGLFAKLISLHETEIVWFRMVLSSLMMLCIFGVPKVSKRKSFASAAAGAMLALHWMLFYCSIKASNVCIGVLCFSLTGCWTAVVEPLAGHRKPSVMELLLSLLTVAGIGCMYFLSPDGDSSVGEGVDVKRGVIIGTFSSLACAIYMVMSKKISYGMRSRDFLQCGMSGGLLLVTLLIPVYLMAFGLPIDTTLKMPTWTDFGWMLCHASFCTVLMYMLQLAALRKLSAFTVNLSYNLEPVYSIVFAMLFFGEAAQLNYSFYIGLALIILSVVLQSVIVARKKKCARI